MVAATQAAASLTHDHSSDAYGEPSDAVLTAASAYDDNLALIRSSTVRNTNHDQSPYRDTPQSELVPENLYGPRSDYLDNSLNPPEGHFPVPEGGQFRVSCEFSHFAYDDPLVYPGEPGRAHLHMFWGNTDVNAHSTYDTLRDSGSGTCNGLELNRTGYWAPALFDSNGGVRIPERIIVYYKGYGLARENAVAYPPGAAMIAEDLHVVPQSEGGVAGVPDQFGFNCSNQYRGQRSPASNTIPTCVGVPDEYPDTDKDIHRTIEMHVKFRNCWNGNDASDPDNWVAPRYGNWFASDCNNTITTPHIEYIISYKVEPGETTAGWYLSSDVDPSSFDVSGSPGSSTHADWWGGWHPDVNQMWIDNCTTYYDDEPSGCGFGYLTNAGPDSANPLPGPALQYRPQYVGPSSVAASTLFNELCHTSRVAGTAPEAAYCTPSGSHTHGTTTTTTTTPTTNPGTTNPGTTTPPGTVPGGTTTSVPQTGTTPPAPVVDELNDRVTAYDTAIRNPD